MCGKKWFSGIICVVWMWTVCYFCNAILGLITWPQREKQKIETTNDLKPSKQICYFCTIPSNLSLIPQEFYVTFQGTIAYNNIPWFVISDCCGLKHDTHTSTRPTTREFPVPVIYSRSALTLCCPQWNPRIIRRVVVYSISKERTALDRRELYSNSNKPNHI